MTQDHLKIYECDMMCPYYQLYRHSDTSQNNTSY